MIAQQLLSVYKVIQWYIYRLKKSIISERIVKFKECKRD